MRIAVTSLLLALWLPNGAACVVGSNEAQSDGAAVEDLQSNAVVHRQCTAIENVLEGRISGCVQEDNLGRFNAVADAAFDLPGDVEIHLQQCRGDGSGCGYVASVLRHDVEGHVFIPTAIVPGAHGHAYRAVLVFQGLMPVPVPSPFIAFP
jgi:hypothetical protein